MDKVKEHSTQDWTTLIEKIILAILAFLTGHTASAMGLFPNII